MNEQSFMERAQRELADRDARILKLETERDLYRDQAIVNMQTVIRQQHEMRRLESLIARLQLETNDE
jgi:hypothetical protein